VAIAGDLSDQARTQRDALPERTAALASFRLVTISRVEYRAPDADVIVRSGRLPVAP